MNAARHLNRDVDRFDDGSEQLTVRSPAERCVEIDQMDPPCARPLPLQRQPDRVDVGGHTANRPAVRDVDGRQEREGHSGKLARPPMSLLTPPVATHTPTRRECAIMIQRLDHDSVSLHVAARPHTVYALVADVTRTPEFSPEVIECTWLDGATEATVGARFRGRNKMPNRPAFSNKPVVTVVEPGRTFAFDRTEPFGGTVEWRYEFEPDGDGTLVTESYTVTAPVSRVGWFIIGTLFARKDRASDLRQGMERTLDRLKEVAERDEAGFDRTEPSEPD